MTSLDNKKPFRSILSNNSKAIALEQSLQEGVQNFKELMIEFEQLHIESDSYKNKFTKQKQRCDSNSCTSAEALKRIIESKDNIIQLVVSTLTRLNETKDLKILDDVFKIIFGESSKFVPSYQETIKCKDIQKITSPIRIKNEVHSSNEDLSFKEESVSEIEGTPTGRTSPIIQMKKLKSSLINSSDFRDKKKCPETWPTPENKTRKLSYSTPLKGKQNGKWRQSRLNLVAVKESNIIDITSSPEFSGGSRSKSDNDTQIKPLIKKESIENDDTILPSPTSGPTTYSLLKSKDSPMKFKKPQLSLKTNKISPEQNSKKVLVKVEQNSENQLITDIKMNDSVSFTQEDSINLLNPVRLPKSLLKHSPVKKENDETYCDTQASISLLQHINKLEDIRKGSNISSPSKKPLEENINITNMRDNDVIQSKFLLQREMKNNKMAIENVKRKIAEPVELVFKEPAPRTKAEKRMLRGWACDKCIDFFGELYKDDPEMMEKKINECSHHRGVHNPTDRQKTPPRYWNPRWDVPEDTDEFNRRNNVA